jgi:drug/metabolite transporter (DMT)-like permease
MAPASAAQRYTVASVCLLLSVAFFVANSELMQAEEAAVPPFFMIWLCHSSMASFLLLTLGRPAAGGRATLRALSRASIALSVGTMTANYLFVLALRMASVTVVNAIYMGNVGPTYILSVALLGERPARQKQLAVGLVLLGIALMALGDQQPAPDAAAADTAPAAAAAAAAAEPGTAHSAHGTGVAVAVLSSATFAVYKVLFKHIVGDVSSTTDTLRILGALGLWCVLPMHGLRPAIQVHF